MPRYLVYDAEEWERWIAEVLADAGDHSRRHEATDDCMVKLAELSRDVTWFFGTAQEEES